MDPLKTVTTSYLLGNLHCPSCVALIKRLLRDEYGDQILWVSPNVVTSVVTVEHQEASPDFIRSMAKTLEGVGFEICGIDTTATSVSPGLDELSRAEQGGTVGGSRLAGKGYGTFDVWSRLWRYKTSSSKHKAALEAAHLENCEACKTAAAQTSPESHPLSAAGAQPARNSSVSSSIKKPTATSPLLESIAVDNGAQPSLMRATLSIGGMTCAVCVNTITDELQKHPWISKVVVNLVSNSATVDFSDASHSKDVVTAVEDLGYDAVLDKVVDLGEQKLSEDKRQVEIQIDGFFCPRCPERIGQTLRNLGSRVEVLSEPSLDKARVRVQYTPDAPRFTIRHIIHAIEATDASLKASIYHAPTLEERSRAIRAKHQRELVYREILTTIIAIPTFVLGIVYMTLVPNSDGTKQFLMKPWTSGLSRMTIALFALATPVYFFAADVFHVRAIKEVRTLWRGNSRTPLLQRFYKFGSMNMLISLGTTIAYMSSVAEMVAAWANKEDHVPDSRFYFDSVVFLTLFLLAGRLIEGYSKSKTGSAVEALAKLRPNMALLVEEDTVRGTTKTSPTPVDELERGDLVRIPHGASPAVDGTVEAGETDFDESSLTGESRPIKKGPGDEVYAGTINKADSITMRVTGACGKSMLDQIVEVVREGQTKRAPVEQVADLLTSYFVPVITLIAVVTWVVWMTLVYTGNVADAELDHSSGRAAFAFQFAIAVFVVACPCGLALAAPTAIFVGGGIAAKLGILAKGGGEAFEKASKIDCVVFDKTGTLTMGGEPQITDSVMFPDGKVDGVDQGTVLLGLKAAEESSSHPIARAIVGFCGSETAAARLGRVEEVAGKGVKVALEEGEDEAGRQLELELAVGNEALMADCGAALSQRVTTRLEEWKREAKSVALVAVGSLRRRQQQQQQQEDQHREQQQQQQQQQQPKTTAWTVVAIMSISDAIRPETRPVIKALRTRGTQVWMLSGDNAITARAVAQRVGIEPDHVLAEVLPSEKAAKIGYLQAAAQGAAGRKQRRRAMVAMVGDGINDSPALATADVGIAIGSGSDVAISSADFVLATSNLAAVVSLLALSKSVLRRIKVNFAWALVYNMLAVPIAAGCLWPVTTHGGGHVRLDPVWAALAMALSSISVVLSSLCLRLPVPLVGFRPPVVQGVSQ